MTEANPNTIGFWPFLMASGPIVIGGLLAFGQFTGIMNYTKRKLSGQSSSSDLNRAVCLLNGVDGNKATGRIVFEAQSKCTGTTKITGEVRGLDPGKHGLYIHELGDLSEACKSTGDTTCDLGFIVADDKGIAKIELTDETGNTSIKSVIGRSVVVGKKYWRVACGVVGLSR
eukprot:327194_1